MELTVQKSKSVMCLGEVRRHLISYPGENRDQRNKRAAESFGKQRMEIL